MVWALFSFILGLALLISGARLLVYGATRLASTLKISSLVIGLTVVAFGTSAPEIAFCSLAAVRGETDLLIGNLIGSNIFNILLVLGISATLTPLIVKKQVIWWDVPIMIGVSSFFWVFASFGEFYRWEGAVLLIAIALYLIRLYFFQKKELASQKHPPKSNSPLWLQLVAIIAGLIFLGFGSELLINYSAYIARFLGVPELLIGLTLVAIGTSLPEMAASLTAIAKNEKDLAVGNVIGSNIFNLLAVMGISALLSPKPIPVPQSVIQFDIPVMIGVAIAVFPIFLTEHKISRWEGILFLFYYLLYLAYILLSSLAHPWMTLFTSAFLFFVLPLTLITLGIGVFRHLYKLRR